MNRSKEMDSKIVFLQETHLLNEDYLKVRRRWRGNIYMTPFTSHSRGVMTHT